LKSEEVAEGNSGVERVICDVFFPLTMNPGTLNIEHRTLNIEGVSPCTLRLLSPALSSLGEEREEAGAAFLVHGRNARIVRGILIPAMTMNPGSAGPASEDKKFAAETAALPGNPDPQQFCPTF
jgi:hypothetical protein